MGWFLRFIESMQAAKKRSANRKVRKTKRRERLQKLQGKGQNQTGNVKKQSKNALKENSKLWFIRVLRIIVQFIESIIKWIIALIGIHMTIIILAAIIVIIVIMSVLNSVDTDILDPSTQKPPEISSGSSTTYLRWTMEELEQYQHYFSKYEQNIFKIAVLTKDSVNGYGTSKKFNQVNGQDMSDMIWKMSLGTQTTESSWAMYKDPQDARTKDVLIDPSDVDPLDEKDELIIGPYQMGISWGLNSFGITEELANTIKQTYSNPNNGSEREYYPYATQVSVAGLYGKMNEQGLNKEGYTKIFKDLAPKFGITTDYERFERESIVLLMKTAYLSAPNEDERAGVLAFLAGTWAMSSDEPDKRGYDNYEIDYSDGLEITTALHQQFFGVGSDGSWYKTSVGESGDLRKLTFGSTRRIKLNGTFLSKPLVAEVVTKYWEVPEIQKYNTDVLNYSKANSQFVLKGIYGIESYLSGKQIVSYLGSKLPVRVVNIVKGNFHVTPGIGQGDWGGKTIEELSNGNREAMKFKQYWGTSHDLQTGSMQKWRENDKWGVPFYYQSSKYDTYPLSYGVINWYQGKGKTLNACAYYMSGYIASALTGKLINSAEMASALIVTKGVNTQGLYTNDGARVTFDLLGINFRQFVSTTQPEVLKSFGLSIKNEKTLWVDRWYYIDEILAQGGLVGVSVSKASVFTNYGHYMVITGKDEATGKYSVYTSSSTKQTQTLYDRSAFDGKLRGHGYFLAKLK